MRIDYCSSTRHEHYNDPNGGKAAASFKTDAAVVEGKIKTAQWKITASDGNAPQEATFNVDDLNIPEFSGESSAIFGIIIENIKTGVTITNAQFVYTVE